MSGQHSSITRRFGLWYGYVDLTHRYAEAIDLRAGVGVAELFTEDGAWNGRDFGLPFVKGRAALERHFVDGSSYQPPSVHLVHNQQLLETSESTIIARSHAHTLLPRGNEVRHRIILYDDVLVHAEEWLFAERTLRKLLSF